MIMTFKCAYTRKLYNDEFVKKFERIEALARRKLFMLANARKLDDLRSPPGNRLEGLKGDRNGYYSIRINSRWRLCFSWNEGDAYDVEIVDYH